MKQFSEFIEIPFMDNVAFPILLGLFILLVILEFVIVLRPWKTSRWFRWINNSLVAVTGLPTARLLLLPATLFMATLCQAEGFGLLNWLEFPAWVAWPSGLLALDYAMYHWHRINHLVPFLWRFHNVHHADMEMDISTAIRFHFGEQLFSIPYRLIVISLFGVSPMMVLVYELVFEAATLFHHSNIRLPKKVEGLLVKLIVTPRMHGIHHSVVKNETDSNYSTVLNVWDRIHSTRRLNIPQKKITIGVPAYRSKNDNKFWRLLILPFTKQRGWVYEDQSVPERDATDKTQVF
ncbi:sterol desaturase family protein [Owenweeksia hongkongensis]|uniref:sterol desaturase family protein n=1 Tax=Owenweeksia hongkongensis TaxID=253245 RepID=UPI003A9585B2